MDAVPMPAYHLWDIKEYMTLMVNPGVTAITSRGCPYECTFCDAEMTPRKYRSMSVEKTVDLLEHIITTYNRRRSSCSTTSSPSARRSARRS